jgi:hypothetical protein
LLNSDRRDLKESVATLGSFHLLHILDRDHGVNYLCSKIFSSLVRPTTREFVTGPTDLQQKTAEHFS